MPNELDGYIIITNHFKSVDAKPKIVYANNNLLSYLGYKLSEIIDKKPDTIFLNWTEENFKEQIIQCVDDKKDWFGSITLKRKNKKSAITKDFAITPVFGLSGEISYYSCRTLIEEHEIAKNTKTPLDDFIGSLWESQKEFSEIYVNSPADLLKIDLKGIITFANLSAQRNFAFEVGQDLFSDVVNDEFSKVYSFFKDNENIDEQTKLILTLEKNHKELFLECHFTPLFDSTKHISGYSVSIRDISKRKEISKKLLALKGA